MNWNPISIPLWVILLSCLTVVIGCSSCEDRPTTTPPTPDISGEIDQRGILDVGDRDNYDVTGQDIGKRPPMDTQTPEDTHLPDTPVDACTGEYGPLQTSAMIQTEMLFEVSGIVSASFADDVLWAHNDSGDTARIFALSTTGTIRNEIHFEGVTAIDFEDIAKGPCPAAESTKTCLWVADIGNNLLNRDELTLYGIEEPDLTATEPGEMIAVQPLHQVSFSYPDGTMDAEALVVSPDGSEFWIFEKASTPEVRVYRGILNSNSENPQTLEQVASFAAPGFNVNMGRLITAADLHPNGKSLAIRVYTGSYEYRMTTPLDFAELKDLAPVQIVIGPLDELQGEAIAYGNDGKTVWTCSEDPTETGLQPIHFYSCEDSEP